MWKNLSCIGLLFLFSFVNYGQSGSNTNISLMNFKSQTNVIPPSPNAAALAKYAEIPVNTHTGIPQISVPIYEWKSKLGQSAVSVNLSYHAGGIKVEDVASNTGAGWSLNAAGVITRSVRGLPDDITWGYLNTPVIADYNTPLNNGDYYLSPGGDNTDAGMNTNPLNILALYNGDMEKLYFYGSGLWDTEQDLFYYNFNGYSGKFVIDKDGSVNKIDVNPLEIAVTYTTGNVALNNSPMKNITGFAIQADNGIKYLFDIKETSTTTTTTYQRELIMEVIDMGSNVPPARNLRYIEGDPTYSNNSIISSYYLSKATDMNSNDIVNYDYDTRLISYIGGWNESLEYHDNNDPEKSIYNLYTHHKLHSQTVSSTKNEIETKQIKKISFPDGSVVDFLYEISRLDVQGDLALTGIKITDVIGTIKNYKLEFSYFNSAIAINPIVSEWMHVLEPADYFKKRLRLDKVKQMDALSSTGSFTLYGFEYNDTLLPPRNSKDQDFWGYYCGPDRYSYTLIPQLHPAVPENLQYEGLLSYDLTAGILNTLTDGADRTPSELYARASTLKKIWLPTGGYTAFNMETNSVNDNTIYFNSNTKYNTVKSSHNNIGQSKILSMPERSDQKVLFYITFKRVNQDGTLYVEPPYVQNEFQPCFQNMVAYNTQISFYVKSSDNTINKVSSFQAVQEGEGRVKVYFSLPLDKQYSLYYIWQKPSNSPCYDNVFFDIETMTKYTIINTSTLVGGLRAASVNHYDSYKNSGITTIYDYKNDNNESSGIIPAIPNYEFHKHAVGKWTCCGGSCGGLFPTFLGYAKFKIRTSNSTQTLGYAFGSNVGYNQVTTARVNSNGVSLGKTVSS